MPDTIQPQQLIDALTANGWTARPSAFTGEIAGYWYPGEGDTGRWLPVHPGGPGTNHALAELARAADTGRRASRVLASLIPAGTTPDDNCGCRSNAGNLHVKDCPVWVNIGPSLAARKYVRRDSPEGQGKQDGCTCWSTNDKHALSCDLNRSKPPASDSGPTPRAQSGQTHGDVAAAIEAVKHMVSMMATNSRDWGQAKDDAWFYGVTVGWGLDPEAGDLPDPDDPEGVGALPELAERFGWTPETVARLRALHRGYASVPGLLTELEQMRPALLYANEQLAAARNAVSEPKAAGLDLSPAVERITASAADVSLCGDTWLPAEVIAGWAHAGGIPEPKPIDPATVDGMHECFAVELGIAHHPHVVEIFDKRAGCPGVESKALAAPADN